MDDCFLSTVKLYNSSLEITSMEASFKTHYTRYIVNKKEMRKSQLLFSILFIIP